MKTFFALVSFAMAVFAASEADKPVITPELLEGLKNIRTWTADANTRWMNATRAEASRMMGTILVGDGRYRAPTDMKTFSQVSSLPTGFDSRTEWSDCSDLIGTARDQSDCGSCWAFGSTEALNDRICIKTGDTTMLSADDTLSCCKGFVCSFSMGCNGGQPSGAWNWFTKKGVCTGGLNDDVGTGASCKPYEFPPCAHHVESDEYEDCGEDEYSTPSCTSSCNEATYASAAYDDDKTFAKSSYSVRSESNIQQEIMDNGPVSAAFSVYDDFLTYTGGVYQHETGSYLGGHAIKLIGWGEDAGVSYWTAVNSWNPTWGEDGLFRILRGSDECGIESQIVAGDV